MPVKKINTFCNSNKHAVITSLFLLFFCFNNRALAQTGTINGYINTPDGKPVANMNVMVEGTSISIFSNSKGYYEIQELSPKEYIIQLFSGDSLLAAKAVTIKGDDTIRTDFAIHNFNRQSLSEIVIAHSKSSYVTELPSASLRLGESLLEAPQSINVVNAKTIKDIGANTTDDILRTASGVLPVNNAGQDIYTMIRGAITQNSILRNGIGAGYFYDMNPDPAMIDRIEFIKGPAGFMISNASAGGMINIVTKQPVHQKILNVEVGCGSWNMLRSSIDLNGEAGKKHAFTYRINTGIKHQKRPYRYGYYNKYFIAGALKYEAGKHTDFTLEYNFVHGKSLDDIRYLPTVNGQLFAIPYDLLISDPNTSGVASYDHYFKLSFHHTFDRHWSINAHMAAVRGRWNVNNFGLDTYHDGGIVVDDTIYRYVYKDDYHNRLYNAIAFADGNYEMGKHFKHHILLGLDIGKTAIAEKYTLSTQRDMNLYYPDPVYYLPEDEVRNFPADVYPYKAGNNYQAIYIQDQISILEKLLVTLGGRYTICHTLLSPDAIAAQTDKKLSPRLGFNYLFSDNFSAYLVFDEAFMPQTGKSVTNQQFEPLTGNNKEIGLKSFYLNKKLSLNIACYRTVRNNMLTVDPDHPGFQKTIGQSVSKGVELDILGYIRKNIVVMANYSYLDSRVTKSNIASEVGLFTFNVPVHNIANLFVKYNFVGRQLKGLSLSAGLQYKEKINSSTTENAFLPGYTLLEAAAGYTYRKWYLNMNVYNLTNKKYVDFGTKYNATDYAYSPGTPLNFRLNVGFNL